MKKNILCIAIFVLSSQNLLCCFSLADVLEEMFGNCCCFNLITRICNKKMNKVADEFFELQEKKDDRNRSLDDNLYDEKKIQEYQSDSYSCEKYNLKSGLRRNNGVDGLSDITNISEEINNYILDGKRGFKGLEKYLDKKDIIRIKAFFDNDFKRLVVLEKRYKKDLLGEEDEVKQKKYERIQEVSKLLKKYLEKED